MRRCVDAAVTVPTFGFIDAPRPPLIQEGEILPRPGGGGTKCRRRGSAQVR